MNMQKETETQRQEEKDARPTHLHDVVHVSKCLRDGAYVFVRFGAFEAQQLLPVHLEHRDADPVNDLPNGDVARKLEAKDLR